MEALTNLQRLWQQEWQCAFDAKVEAIKRECQEEYQRAFHEKLLAYIEQAKLARHRQFGPSCESANGQGLLFNEAEDLASSAPEVEAVALIPEAAPAASTQPAVKRGKRSPLPAELKRVDIVHEIPPAERLCACGTPMIEIGEDISEQLDIVPMQIRVLRHPQTLCVP